MVHTPANQQQLLDPFCQLLPVCCTVLMLTSRSVLLLQRAECDVE